MTYLVRFTFQDGRTGTFSRLYATREEAERAIDERKEATGLAYSVEEVAGVARGGAFRNAFREWMEDEGKTFLGTLRETHRNLAGHVLLRAFTAGEKHGRAQPDATPNTAQPAPVKPALGVMPRRVWEEQRILALAEAIVRSMGQGEGCASVPNIARVHEWAMEIVEECERMDEEAS